MLKGECKSSLFFRMDYSLISESLVSRVGFRQPIIEPALHPDLISTGLNVSGISERFLSPDFISDCLVFFDGLEIADYDEATTYKTGDKAKFDINGKDSVFYSLQDNNLNHAYTDSEYWESGLSNLLRNYRENAAKEVIKEAIALHNLNTYSKKVIKASPIFSENTKGKYIEPQGKFIGLRLKIAERQNLRMDIGKIGLKSEVAQTVTFYLFHSSQPDALQTFDIEIAANEAGRHVWKEIDLSMGYMDENVSAGGYYVFGYFENDNKLYGYDFENYWACVNCSRYNPNYKLYDTYRSFYQVTPVILEPNGIDIPELPEYYEDIKKSNSINFNLSVTITCDPTNLLLQTISVFDIAYQQKLAILILQDMMYSDRINDSATNVEGKIRYLLDGEKSERNYKKGLVGQYNDSLKQITIDFSDMDVACFANQTSLYEGSI